MAHPQTQVQPVEEAFLASLEVSREEDLVGSHKAQRLHSQRVDLEVDLRPAIQVAYSRMYLFHLRPRCQLTNHFYREFMKGMGGMGGGRGGARSAFSFADGDDEMIGGGSGMPGMFGGIGGMPSGMPALCACAAG